MRWTGHGQFLPLLHSTASPEKGTRETYMDCTEVVVAMPRGLCSQAQTAGEPLPDVGGIVTAYQKASPVKNDRRRDCTDCRAHHKWRRSRPLPRRGRVRDLRRLHRPRRPQSTLFGTANAIQLNGASATAYNHRRWDFGGSSNQGVFTCFLILRLDPGNTQP